jgi:hypothetical protein
VTTTWTPKTTEPESTTESEQDQRNSEAADDAPEVKALSLEDNDKAAEGETVTPLAEEPTAVHAQKVKGRVLFLYTCPSKSPIKFRMVYSSSVRSVQQDAKDKAGVDIVGKVGLPHARSVKVEGLHRSRHPTSLTSPSRP